MSSWWGGGAQELKEGKDLPVKGSHKETSILTEERHREHIIREKRRWGGGGLTKGLATVKKLFELVISLFREKGKREK